MEAYERETLGASRGWHPNPLPGPEEGEASQPRGPKLEGREPGSQQGWEGPGPARTLSGLQALGPPGGGGRPEDLLQRLLDFQRQQADLARQQAEYQREQAEDFRKVRAEKRVAEDKTAKLLRRRQRQEARRAWASGVAKVLAVVCALLSGAMLVAMLNAPSYTWVNAVQWRGNGRWEQFRNACWSPNVPYCLRWQKAYGISASLSFTLEMCALLIAVGVAMGWSIRLHTALVLFLAGTWCAALTLASMFWLSTTYWLAVFVSSCMLGFIVASVLLLPSVVLLPLAWLYARLPWVGAGTRSGRGAIQLEGLDCQRTTAVHWAAAALGRARNPVSRFLLGALLRLLAMTEDDLDRPGMVSPLFVAAEGGSVRAVRILLAAGADPDHAFSSYQLEGPYYGVNFPLKVAAARGHREVVRELLRADADPAMVDDKTRSALHEAAVAGRGPVADVLLGFGAAAGAADVDGRTPLHLAAAGGHSSVVEVLLRSGVDVDAVDRFGCTPLQAAAAGGHTQVVERLLTRGASANTSDIEGISPLHAAAVGGHAGVVEALLGAGLEPNTPPDVDGYTPLHAAVVGGNTNVVEALLAGGAEPNLADRHGYTPLHAAIVGGNLGAVEALLAANADPNRRDMDGNTPLHVAAAAGSLEAVRAIRACGRVRNVAARNAGGCSARQVAEMSGWNTVAAELEAWETQPAGMPPQLAGWAPPAPAAQPPPPPPQQQAQEPPPATPSPAARPPPQAAVDRPGDTPDIASARPPPVPSEGSAPSEEAGTESVVVDVEGTERAGGWATPRVAARGLEFGAAQEGEGDPERASGSSSSASPSNMV